MVDKKLSDFSKVLRARPITLKFSRQAKPGNGYFLPHEGANNIALALFSFPSLKTYEEYRAKAAEDPECQEAMSHYRKTKCWVSYERSFMRPIFKHDGPHQTC